MGCESLDYDIFEDFKFVFPSFGRMTIRWYNINVNEIAAILNDGQKLCYNFTTRSIRNVYDKDKYINAEEDEKAWRFEFSSRLNSMMYIKGYNQHNLAEASKLSQSIISQYLTGRKMPTVYSVAKIARVLSCSISYLIDFE